MPDINDLNNNGDIVTGVDTVKKSKTGLIAGIAAVGVAGVVAVVAGGGVAAYCLSDFVKNQVKLRLSSPEKYYAWVNEKNADDAAKKLADAYQKGLDKAAAGQKTQVSLRYDASDDFKNLLIDEFGIDDSEGSSKEILNFINNTNNITIGATGDAKDNLISGNTYIEYNDERLYTLDIASDNSAMQYFLRVPDLTEKWLGFDTSKMIEDELYDEEQKEFVEAYKKAMSDPASVLTPQELEQEAARYIKVWNDSVGEVTLEKKQTFTINDIDVNYTVVSVEIDEKKANEIAQNFTQAAKDDELLKDVLVNRLSVIEESEYNEKLDEALEDLQSETDLGDDVVTVSTYIDPKGVIRGFDVKGDDENEEFHMIIGKQNEKVRGEVSLYDGDTEPEFIISLTAEESDKKYSGDITMNADDETGSIEFTDFEIVDEEFGYFNADIVLNIPDVDPIGINFSTDGKSQTIAGDIVIEGKNYGRLTFNVGVQNGAEPVVPSSDNAYMISSEDDLTDFWSDYTTEEDVTAFFNGFLKKLGFSDDFSEDLADELSSELFDTYDYDYDYDDDYDDYDWDKDDDDSSSSSKDKDKDKDDDFDDDFDDDDDYDFDDYNIPDDGQSYIVFADKDYDSFFFGYGSDFDAKFADIEKDGTYTVTLTAKDKAISNVGVLGIEMQGIEGIENAKVAVKDIKVDGKSIDLTSSEPYCESFTDTLEAVIYADEEYLEDLDGFKNCFDGSNITNWKSLEITFEVTGIK